VVILSSTGVASQTSAPVPTLWGPNQDPRQGVEILSDTQGVDFGPYLRAVLTDIQKNWCAHIPDSAKTRRGELAIELMILRTGRIGMIRMVNSSLDSTLDWPAWAGVYFSGPFQPLPPTGFKGEFLALRVHFYYNQAPGNLAANHNPADVSTSGGQADLTAATEPNSHQRNPNLVQRAILIQYVADLWMPDYPKKAREAGIEGIVWLDAEVKENGKIGNIEVVSGDPALTEASTHAIRGWRFHPAEKNGKKIEDHVQIEVEFRLSSERVGAYIIWPQQQQTLNLPR